MEVNKIERMKTKQKKGRKIEIEKQMKGYDKISIKKRIKGMTKRRKKNWGEKSKGYQGKF